MSNRQSLCLEFKRSLGCRHKRDHLHINGIESDDIGQGYPDSDTDGEEKRIKDQASALLSIKR